MLDVLNLHIKSLDKNLALNMFVFNDVHSMLGDGEVIDSSGFTVLTLTKNPVLNSVHSPDV